MKEDIIGWVVVIGMYLLAGVSLFELFLYRELSGLMFMAIISILYTYVDYKRESK